MAGWQADKIQVNFEILKIGSELKYLTCCFISQVYRIILAVPMHSGAVLGGFLGFPETPLSQN